LTGAITKIATGIPGFDFIAKGGLPEGRTALVCGSAGSGKTIFMTQFLIAGIENCDQKGIFVTFEEQPRELRRNMLGFGWDIESYESAQKWGFVDASPEPEHVTTFIGDYDFGALLARIDHAVKSIGAKRVVLDSISSVFSHFPDSAQVRYELYRIAAALRELEVTALLTTERVETSDEIARHGVEEFVADTVIILRNKMDGEMRRRTVEILKVRGAAHQKGQYPFTFSPNEGITVMPLSAMELKQSSADIRIPSGNEDIDRLCGGGLLRDSIIVASGATGSGKTLMVNHFLSGGFSAGERCLLLAFEESSDQLRRNATGWGFDFEHMEATGHLKVVCDYPETAGLEEHLVRIKRLIDEFKPNRVAIDSLSALERVASPRGFREFMMSVTSFCKQEEITGMFTAATSALSGGTSITDPHISAITDTIFLLRYVELKSEMRRGIAVVKMRGSQHDKHIREFVIDNSGMHILEPFRNVAGILSGNPTLLSGNDLQQAERSYDGDA
jgi:circadian clock protein KaiC